MNAKQAIKKIKSERTEFMGQVVEKYATPIQVREQLRIMAESGDIRPSEYWKALKITWPQMSNGEKRYEEWRLQ